ncbi:MAG: hypothetical protein ACPGAP_03105, partial [Akkermansiaceae bacterium]
MPGERYFLAPPHLPQQDGLFSHLEQHFSLPQHSFSPGAEAQQEAKANAVPAVSRIRSFFIISALHLSGDSSSDSFVVSLATQRSDQSSG